MMNSLKGHTSQNELKGFNSRMQDLGIVPTLSISDKKGECLLAHADFMAFEGDFSAKPSPFLMLNLCTGHIGRMKREGEGPSLEGVLRPGTVAMALPGTIASGYWPQTQMLGIAIKLDAFTLDNGDGFYVENLIPAASQLHNDPLLTAVMTALWRDAEVHGLSGAFFEQGIHTLLNRLVGYEPKHSQKNIVYPLNGRRLQRTLDLMESRLGGDVSVAELAHLTDQDVRSFTRSFQASTGFSPYAYFTFRRMEYAKRLLVDKSLMVTDVALQVGYANPSKFSAAFKSIVGVTPNVWRKQ
ncbi:AraC family transcriptional regulator [Marinomonas rhizomae]|uniref:AraC family transcriptional regulator n=1 Tax=Marinomonas rhizomae TaxID=491948 RepID=A0A366J0D4_9GAMM|nr:AraC family transcriptional regulator [Marinomonas rhizomae]RBP79418.1 AraC family transcriptional regulator [Marinomonas rhizomae]RNF71346.1 AraC family transcriptional regulator [Marinomonas rhizomae]